MIDSQNPSNSMVITSIKDLLSHTDSFLRSEYDLPIYRGQSNSDWKITSSLERRYKIDYPVQKYYNEINSEIEIINATLNTNFQPMPRLSRVYDDETFPDLPCIEFVSFLRHHGFPTPVIDWSRSPYIALFFACEDMGESDIDGALFKYSAKLIRSAEPETAKVNRAGSRIKSHQRHYVQQSEYLYTVMNHNEWLFAGFESAILCNPDDNAITKYIIPHNCKASILTELNSMNINAYTLYMDADAFIQSIASNHYIRFKSRNSIKPDSC